MSEPNPKLLASLMMLGGEAGVLGQWLLGCYWGTGRAIHAPDDPDPCPEQATQMMVLHIGEQELFLKLCPKHLARVQAESTPRTGA